MRPDREACGLDMVVDSMLWEMGGESRMGQLKVLIHKANDLILTSGGDLQLGGF